jgi:hypothetical protein
MQFQPGLRNVLKRDPAYKASLLFQPIGEAAYYDNDGQVADAVLVPDCVKAVFQGTHSCKKHTMDKNPWHVVMALLQLAIILFGRGRFRQESVFVPLPPVSSP